MASIRMRTVRVHPYQGRAKSLPGAAKSRTAGTGRGQHRRPRRQADGSCSTLTYLRFPLEGENEMKPTEADIKAAADPKMLDDLVLANRILFWLGVLDGYGHVSVRDPRDPEHFFLARSLAPALVTLEDIMVFDRDAEPVEARGRDMYSERYIHGEVYRVRPDVHSVVHSHSPTVIPFSISQTPLKPVYH